MHDGYHAGVCVPFADDCTSVTSIPTIIPSGHREPLLSLALAPTLTSKPIITLAPSSTPTPYQLSLSVVDLHTTGRLWVYDEQETRFLIIDMNTGTVEQTAFSQNNCSVVLKYNSTDVICQSSRNLYLYDLVTGSIQNLPITAPDKLYMAPYIQNSRFLVYGNWSEAGDWLVDVSYLDMMTGQERLVIENSPDSEYYISSDGSYVIAEIDNHIIDLLSNPGGNLTPVGYENLVYNPYSLVWSPESNLLYIGAAEPGSYDFPPD